MAQADLRAGAERAEGAHVQLRHRGHDVAPSAWRAASPAATRSSSSTAATTATPTPSWSRPAPARSTFGHPDSAGVPAAFTQHTIVLPFNDTEALRAAFAANPDQIAGVIVEPVPGNAGLYLPSRATSSSCAS